MPFVDCLSLGVSNLLQLLFYLYSCWPTTKVGRTESELRACIPLWMVHGAHMAGTGLVTSLTLAAKTVETLAHSMRCVLWESGLSPWASWWLCGVWCLQTHRRTVAAATPARAPTGTLAIGKIRRRQWHLSWWALEWPCCCFLSAWEWGTSSGSSRDCRRPRTAEQRPLLARRTEKCESN